MLVPGAGDRGEPHRLGSPGHFLGLARRPVATLQEIRRWVALLSGRGTSRLYLASIRAEVPNGVRGPEQPTVEAGHGASSNRTF
jgi:hypothetical protein